MYVNIFQHIIRFFVLVVVQIYVLNNILFLNIINPYIYIYFILLLPFETPNFILIILSFILGFTVDLFTGSYAIHAFATTFIGYIRPFVLKLYSPFDGYDKNTKPTIEFYDIYWWLKYAFTITFIHHSILFLLETFHLHNLFHTTVKALISTILTVILITLLQHFFHKSKSKK